MPRTKETRNPFGSIFRRELTINGKKAIRFDARKRYVDAEGKKQEKFKRCRTATEAQIALTNFAKDIERELSAEIEKEQKKKEYSFLALTAYFRKHYLIEAVIVKDRQVAGYRQDISKLNKIVEDFEIFFGDIPLSDFNYEIVRLYSINLATNPKKTKNATEPPTQATINRKLALLRKIFNVGIQLGWTVFNPVNQGKPLVDTKAERNRTRILTFEEERRLLAACTGNQFATYKRRGKEIEANLGPIREHLRPIIIMAIDTGMRKGEIFKLERGQIDLETLVINLRPEQTKGLKARSIPISARLNTELEKYFAYRTFRPDEAIFSGVKNCRTAFASACDKAGIKDLVFHDLRHTATTWLDQAGISEAVKKNFVGHSSDIVHQNYNNLSSDVLERARAKINEFRAQIEADLNAKGNPKENTKKAA